MRVKTIVFLIIGVLFLLTETHATHYMGGEITWECLPNGRYRFKMRVYRECYYGTGWAATFGATETIQSTGGGVASITMTRVHLIDLSPQCKTNPTFPRIICPGMVNSAANMGAQQENYYTSDGYHPTGVLLTGTPPPEGWTFSWSGCCRNPSTNVINSSSLNWYLRAKMYSYNNQNVNPCFDDSPAFTQRPTTVTCNNYPFTYHHLATDNNRDSLVYSWALPMMNASAGISSYAPGYSYNHPLPGVMHHPFNVPASLDSRTGTISFTSHTNGAFITSIKVSAYKHGILVSEIWRDYQIVVSPCVLNQPPVIQSIQGFADVSGNFRLYVDTIYAGDFVSFPVIVSDIDPHPDNSPQTATLTPFGNQFGQNFSNTQMGCNPPCAILSPAYPLSGFISVQTNFQWQTACSHIPTCKYCGSNVHDFVFQAKDDNCPIPAQSSLIVRLVILPKPVVPPPALRCSDVLKNGMVKLRWTHLVDSLKSTRAFLLYRATNLSGPWILVDSLTDMSLTEYTDSSAAALAGPLHYKLRSLSGCEKLPSEAIDSLSTISVKIQSFSATSPLVHFTWNQAPVGTVNPYKYMIFEYPGQGSRTLIDSTFNTFYMAQFNPLNPPLGYGVELQKEMGTDSLGQMQYCTSVSNLALTGLTGVETLESSQSIRVVPNPFDESLNLIFSNEMCFGKTAIIQLCQPDGREVFYHRTVITPEVSLNVTGLSSGLYFLKIELDGLRYAYKLVKL